MSTTILPAERPSATPSSPNSTASTSGVSGTMMMMTSACSATSLAEPQATPPASSQLLRHAAAREQKSSWPPFMRLQRHGRPMMPRPMNPTFMRAILQCSRFTRRLWRKGRTSRGRPWWRPRACTRSRSSRRSRSASSIAEQEAVVDLARAGLVAARIVRDLDVGDASSARLDGRRQVALHDLHVVDVVLQIEIVRADLVDDRRAPAPCWFRKKPGMSRVLIGSISSLMPALASSGAA